MELWTAAHGKTLLPALALMILAALLLRRCIGSKSLKIRLIPLKILAVLLLLLEVGKQICSFAQGYDLYHIPLHFCSLVLLALPAIAFYNGPHKDTVHGVGAALLAAISLLMLIYPALIYSAGNIEDYFKGFMDFHTVTFHNIVLFAFILTVALQIHTPTEKSEPKAVVLFTVGFCVTAASIAQLLQTNYANFYTCNIGPLETVPISVQAVLGYVPTQILYVLIVATLHVLFVLMSYWLYRFLRKKAQSKAAAPV